jgi:hypothetical protein
MSPTDEPTEETAETPDRPGHEESDVEPTQIVFWAVALAVLTALTAFVVAVLYAYIEETSLGAVFDRAPTPWEGAEPPEPRLQVDTLQLPREVRARERDRLEGWEWVDRDARTAKIPIERAKELVVDRYEQGAETRWLPEDAQPSGPQGEDSNGGSGENGESGVDGESPSDPSQQEQGEGSEEAPSGESDD